MFQEEPLLYAHPLSMVKDKRHEVMFIFTTPKYMNDQHKTKDQLIQEIQALRQRNADLEAAEAERRQIEERLTLFEGIIEASQEAIAISDAEGQLVYINPAHEQLFGRSFEEARQCNYRDYYPPESVEILNREVAPVLAQGESWEGVLDVFDGYGRRFPLWERAGSLLDAEGKMQYGFGFMHDETERKQMEEALRKSEGQLRSLFETMAEGVVLIAPDGQIVRANPAAEGILGLKRSEIETRNYVAPEWEIFRSDGTPMLPEEMAGPRAMQERHLVKDVIMGVKHPDGTISWINVSAAPLINETGSFDGIVGTFTDITERKRAEEALRESEEKFRTMFDVATDGILIADLEQKHFYTGNAAICQMLGYQLEELQQLRVMDIHPANDLPFVLDQFERQTRGEFQIARDIPVKRKDGSVFYADVNSTPIKLADKRYLMGIFRDITERKQAEEALRREQKILNDFIDLNPYAIQVFDYDGFPIRHNHAFLELFQSQPPGAVSILETPVHQQDGIANKFLEARAGSIVEFGEIWNNPRAHFPDRDDIPDIDLWLKGMMFPIKDTYGVVIRIVTMIEDITDRKRAEEEIRTLNAELEQRVKQRTADLEAANRELRSFAYIVSHDLKAPLRGISQLAHWISTDYSEVINAAGQEMLVLLQGRAKRMNDLVEGILEYSRVGRIVGEDEQIPLHSFVRDIIDSIAPPDHIQITIQDELPDIVADQTQIHQLFQNLIGNAIKFMDKAEGQITIGCVEQETHWIFRVTDNGPGIDSKYHDKIFQIFQTLQPRDERENTGIGLALVKKIVELYGGKIWVESIIGKGSTFYFTYPKERNVLEQKF